MPKRDREDRIRAENKRISKKKDQVLKAEREAAKRAANARTRRNGK